MGELLASTSSDTASWCDNSDWYRALTLVERIAGGQLEIDPSSTSDDTTTAAKQLARWKGQAPFDKAPFFEQRLAADAITEADLLALLAESSEDLKERLATQPSWLLTLQQAFVAPAEQDLSPLPLAEAPIDPYAAPMEFLLPFRPLIWRSIHQMEQCVRLLQTKWSVLPFDSARIISLLCANLPALLLPKISRTLVLELHVARLREQLRGDTPQERFASYISWLEQAEHSQAFLQEYSVLARQLLITLDQWVQVNLELLQRLCSDWSLIMPTLAAPQEPGLLTQVRAGAGDTHRYGHSVVLLTFSSGWRMVYKPRSLAIDQHFQELVHWLNTQGQQPPLRLLRILERGAYGWSEFVEAHTCQEEAEVERFYERQGAYLALLYVLDAVDVHYENVIASGEHPMLVDLETLFHPHASQEYRPGSEHPASEAYTDSVLRIGLLPLRLWSSLENDGVDISGLGGKEGQRTPRPVSRWSHSGTDQMQLIHEPGEIEGKQNQPSLQGVAVQTISYTASLLQGFQQTYRRLMTLRQTLVDDLLPRFAHDEIRFIARATRLYSMVLFDSLHPNVLRDALRRERCWDRLWWAVPERPFLARLIAAEREDLQRGDIPFFRTSPRSHDLFTSQGKQIVNVCAESSLERVQRRIEHLSEDDMERQSWLIRASFTSLVMEGHDRSENLIPLKSLSHTFRHEELVEQALAIGEQLRKMAIQQKGATGWLSVVQTKGFAWNLQPADISLYHGNAGIALFLAYLGDVTHNAEYTELAKSTLKAIYTDLAYLKNHDKFVEHGAFIGIGSVIYLLSHLGTLWQDATLFEKAEELVALVPELVKKDSRYDILAGSAGCLSSLLCLYTVAPSSHVLKTAILCGDHLLSQAQQMETGIAWNTIPGIQPPAGFSHGVAGIVLSLLQLTAVSGLERFRQAAMEALKYERSLYVPELQNWPVRALPVVAEHPSSERLLQPETFKNRLSWTHGAPGIGLARLATLTLLDDAETRQEISVALQTTIEQGFGWDHEGFGPNSSLCHGDFGNLETLLVATLTLKDPSYEEHLERITAMLLESIKTHGWVTGIPLQVEVPGLLNGIAGIGYELLRLAAPRRVPSILLLEPPKSEVILRENMHVIQQISQPA